MEIWKEIIEAQVVAKFIFHLHFYVHIYLGSCIKQIYLLSISTLSLNPI